MDVNGHYSFDAPVDKVWMVLLNSDTLARCIPGCDSLVPLGNDRYEATLARIHRWTGMDGVRAAEGGEGVTGAMIRARIWVDGRLAGGLQALLGTPMAAYSGCGERDGGIGHGRGLPRTVVARVCGDVGSVAGWAVRPGTEWLAGRAKAATELGFPRPAPGEMQSEAARRAGDPSDQSEDPPPVGLGDHGPLA